MNLHNLRVIEDINLNEYVDLVKKIKCGMKNPEWLGDFTLNDLKIMIKNDTKIWNYYLKDEFVCSMMLIPSDEKSLNKFDLNLNYKDVVDYGPMFVNPKYIGNSLQYQMLKKLDEYSFTKGYKYALSTVHPENIYSINNLIKNDFELKGTKSFKRGIRNIYLKKLK